MKAKKRLFLYLKPMRKYLVFAIGAALIFSISQLAQPFLLGRALDASKNNDKNLFLIYVFVSLGLIIIGTIFDYIFDRFLSKKHKKTGRGNYFFPFFLFFTMD